MSDLPVPPAPVTPAPVSSVQRFGVRTVGPIFEYDGYDENGNLITVEARTVPSLSFDDWLRYNGHSVVERAGIIAKSKEASERLEMLMDPKTTPEQMTEKMHAYLATVQEREAQAWVDRIEAVLLLVAESYRDQLRPLLLRSDARAVNELRVWLEDKVIGPVAHEVQEVGGVDPTLPPSPSGTAPNGDSGALSDDTEPSSTD